MSGRAILVAVAATVATVAACASTTAERRTTAIRVEPTPMDNVRWDPATGKLECVASAAQLTLAPALRNRVQVIARDLVVVVLPQASSALLVTVSPSYLRGKRAGVLGDLPEIWKELHQQATGVDLREGDLQGAFRTRGGRLVIEYSYDPVPKWGYPATTSIPRSTRRADSPSSWDASSNGGSCTPRSNAAGSPRSTAWKAVIARS